MDPHRYADLRGNGWSRRQLKDAEQAGQLHRVVRGAYLTGAGGSGPALVDRLKALLLVLPPAAVIGYHTAAELHGFGVLPSRRLQVLVPTGTPVPDIRGVSGRQAVLPIGEPVLVAGVPCVSPARCAVDLARTCRRLDALAVLDAALRSGRCDPGGLANELLRHDGLRGVRQARELLPLADPRAECPQESHLRLVLTDGRLAPPEPQLWVPDDQGRPRYRLDLGYEYLRVGVEYDGASHLERHRLRSDRQRHNWLAARGWTMRYFTDVDLYHRQPQLVATVREAIARVT